MKDFALNSDTRRRVLEVFDAPVGDPTGDAVRILQEQGFTDDAIERILADIEWEVRVRKLAERHPPGR